MCHPSRGEKSALQRNGHHQERHLIIHVTPGKGNTSSSHLTCLLVLRGARGPTDTSSRKQWIFFKSKIPTTKLEDRITEPRMFTVNKAYYNYQVQKIKTRFTF